MPTVSRKRRNITEADVERWIDQGFGQGDGSKYKPWARVRDVPSIGRSTRFACLRSYRTHHLYSDVESAHFLLADFRPNVCEIREQFALLPREETLNIADALDIRHPRFPGTTTPIVMTSDLVVSTATDGGEPDFVLSVKRSSSILPGAKSLRRTIEKLAIERAFWQRKRVPWYLVTEAHFDATVVRNLGLLRPSRRHWGSVERCRAARDLASRALSREGMRHTLRELIPRAQREGDLGYQDFGLAVWKRWLPLDLTIPLRWDRPLAFVETPR